jgi:dipeptidyl aminopeptidase/acylaminoacyl peptidase
MIRRLLATALLAGLALAQPAQAERPPIRDFFKTPAFQAPKLSPSGRYLAIRAAGADGRVRLAVIDLETLQPAKVVAGFSNADIGAHAWVNEDRLVFQIRSPQDGTQEVIAPGLWAVNRDGGTSRQLILSDYTPKDSTSSIVNDRRLEGNWTLASTVADGSDEVLVARQRWSSEPESVGLQLSRLNTRTGALRNLNTGLPDHVGEWLTDSSGEPRSVTSNQGGGSKIYLRQPDGQWKLWQDLKSYYDAQIEPYWFGTHGEMLGLKSFQGYAALFRIDPKTLEADAEPLLNLKGYDFNGSLIVDTPTQRLLGVQFETDAPGSAWFDPSMKAMQADIDAKLPSTANQIECQRCLEARYIVVTARSDQQPPVYFLYKPADKSLQVIARLRPEIKAAEMGQRDVYRIPARDKLELPVLVTQPPGKAQGPRPAVVLVHGGPNVRGTHWPWEAQAQFLASRGYVVLEPEFRGSTGYGWKLFRAGWQEWGLAMQDDLADTLAWAVKQGWVDPKRVCIAGSSYGGYAALMGAVKQSDLFRCAVSWVGVTDLGLLSSIHWSDASEESRKYGMKPLIGDPLVDAERFKATSPLQRAKEIKMPLLVAYGGDDSRVPIKHGTDFKAALRADQEIEWVVYPDEGHGWHDLKTHEDFWGRVERFLAKHLAPAS